MGTGINETFFAEGAEVAWKKSTPEKFEVAATDGVLETKEGPQRYKCGYRIITGPQGEQYSMPKETFETLKDDNGDGTATPKKILKLVKMAEEDGAVKTSWGETLEYRAKKDYIIRHGKGDYGVVKSDIFEETYQRLAEKPEARAGSVVDLIGSIRSPRTEVKLPAGTSRAEDRHLGRGTECCL